jgi:tRNA nucleotidyltransferase (CCA-adding enzyme)
LELDVSIPRRESKEGKGHAGFLVDSDPSLNVVEAARRRDFTINALYADPTTGAILDPFGGLADLKSRTLRVTDAERFQDDPLRVLRAVQFVARLGFAVEPESMRLMREMAVRGDLGELSRERVTEEFGKLLYKGKRPSEGMAFARDVGALDAIFPGMSIADFDGWAAALDRAAAFKDDRLVPLAAFFSGFLRETLAKAESVLAFNKREMETVRALIAGATYKEAAPTNPANEARRTLKRAYPAAPETYVNFLRALGRDGEAEEFLSLVREHGLTPGPLLQGGDLIRELGMRPGVAIGQALKAIEAARDRGEISTREEALAFVRETTSKA